MTNPEEVAVAFLVTQNTKEQQEQAMREELARLEMENARLRAIKNAAKPRAESRKREIPREIAPAVMGLPEKGTLDAAGFMAALRKTGQRRSEAGTLYTDQREVRGDTIRAIAAYCGYDTRGQFGAQETAARMRARQELQGALPAQEYKRTGVQVTGGDNKVQGAPDSKTRRMADLNGRAVVATEALIQHEKDAANMERSAQARTLSAGLARVEEDRLRAIHSDISALCQE